MIAGTLRHPVTNRLAMVFGLWAVVVLAYSSSFVSMWALWQTADHRHGILVFPIAAFLIWRARYELPNGPVSIDAGGLLVLVTLAGIWVVARLTGIQVLEHATVLAMLPASVLAFVGSWTFRKLMFPLMFVLIAVPISDSFIPFLMAITADISTALLRITGIPVLREGQYLSLPGGNFVVADVCSGARYLITGMMVVLLYGYLTYSRAGKRVVLLAVTAVALVLANGLRAFIVMAVASATDMQYFGGRDHVYFGWLLFGIVMMLIMWTGARYADVDAKLYESSHSESGAAHGSRNVIPMIVALGLIMLAITVKPLQADFGQYGTLLAAAAALLIFIAINARQGRQSINTVNNSSDVRHHGWARLAAAGGAVTLVLLTPRFVAAIEETAMKAQRQIPTPPTLDCRDSGSWPHSWQPQFGAPDFEFALAFDCGGDIVSLYLAGYASTLQGRELISSAHYAVPPIWDRFSKSGTRSLISGAGRSPRIVEVIVDRSDYAAVVWYWYDIDGHIVASPLLAKVRQFFTLVRGRPAGGRVVVLETAVKDDLDAARRRLELAATALISNEGLQSEGEPT